MKKIAVSILLAISVFFSNTSSVKAQKNNADTKAEKNVGVTDLIFNKDSAVEHCLVSEFSEQRLCGKEDASVNVQTLTENTESLQNPAFYYIVSGGRIIGEGERVVWSFEKMPPGKYTITVGVGEDYAIRGKTITKTFELKQCLCCYPVCECVMISVLGPTNAVDKDNLILFKAKTVGGKQDELVYNWKVSGGTITFGQGSKEIIVKAASSSPNSVTATLEVEGLCQECPNSDSLTVMIKNK